jgi:iron(III) transport system permease protein
LSFSASGAAALSLFSIVLCVAILVAETLLRGGANYTKLSAGSRRPASRQQLGRATPLALVAMLLLVGASLGIPLGMLGYWGIHASKAALENAAAGLHYLAPAALTSVLLGLAVALVSTIMALPLAILAVRHSGPVVTVLERSVYIAFALPDLVAAIALAYVATHFIPSLYGSVFLLIVASTI